MIVFLSAFDSCPVPGLVTFERAVHAGSYTRFRDFFGKFDEGGEARGGDRWGPRRADTRRTPGRFGRPYLGGPAAVR
ncbi:hypothetical protein ACFV6D_35615 [Kitasatospora sp. NPDC059812]|uniref:hypothetical protein n=1 Tax=Kitasatospora sp. NPDC059812 TaxID=3346958 RepID=UPI00364737BB